MRRLNRYCLPPISCPFDPNDDDVATESGSFFDELSFTLSAPSDFLLSVTNRDAASEYGQVFCTEDPEADSWDDITREPRLLSGRVGEQTLYVKVVPHAATPKATARLPFSVVVMFPSDTFKVDDATIELLDELAYINRRIFYACEKLQSSNRRFPGFKKKAEGRKSAILNDDPGESIEYTYRLGEMFATAIFTRPDAQWIVRVDRKWLVPLEWPERADSDSTQYIS